MRKREKMSQVPFWDCIFYSRFIITLEMKLCARSGAPHRYTNDTQALKLIYSNV